MTKAGLFTRHQKQVCVVMPVYKATPSPAEILSIQRCLEVLAAHDLVLVVPQALQTGFYEELSAGRVRIERFADHYFEGIAGYNQLVMAGEFYARFQAYEYMLLYQLDAYIFRDDLAQWCAKGYDYVAPPWMDDEFVKRYWTSNSRIGNWLGRLGVAPKTVGNGGFSLRKIRKCRVTISLLGSKTKKWDSNEDIFWSLYVPYYFPLFRTPSRTEALLFGFETEPARCFALTGQRLPMGCHAWEKYDPSFWKQFIPVQ
jgi:hypothetical protein